MTLLDDPPGTPDGAAAPPHAASATDVGAEHLSVVHELPVLPSPDPRAGRRGALVALLVAVVGLALLVAVVAAVAIGGGSSAPAAEGSSYGVVIPKGTGKRIASGFHLYIIPTDLQLHVGDSLVVVNDDTQVHEVGPFFVRPGETMIHTFTEPGRFVGACTFHPSGEVAIEIFPVDVPIKPPYLPPQTYT